MPAFARWLSALAVSRWCLEGLADLALHGRHSTQDYAFKVINTISMSLHPQDATKLAEGLEAPAEAFAEARTFPLPSDFLLDKGPYISILLLFVIFMTSAVLIIMGRKDVK